MRLVDADEVMRDAEHFGAFRGGRADLADLAILLCGNPIDAEPVKHGRWIEVCHYPYPSTFKCSLCGKEHGGEGNYCPNCGARMDGVVE